MSSIDPMEAYWDRENARGAELDKFVIENKLGLSESNDVVSDGQPVTDELGLEEFADEDDNGDLSDEEINKAVDALTKRKGSKDADSDPESD